MAFPEAGRWEPGPDLFKDLQIHRKSRFRRKNDTGKPKRVVTAYDVYFRNTFWVLKRQHPTMNQQQLFSYVGRLWRETTTWRDRQVCSDFADAEKDVYDQQMIEWQKRREMKRQVDRKKLKAALEENLKEKKAPEPPKEEQWGEEDCKIQ